MTIERRIRGLHYHQWLENTDSTPFGVEVLGYDDTSHSMQAASFMLGLAAGAGSSTSTSPKYLAAVMAELHGGSSPDDTVNLSRTANMLAAIEAKYSHKGTSASTYNGAAIRADLGNGVTAARAAVLALVSGDSNATTATAAFGVDWESSLSTSAFTYGVDLEGPAAHDGYANPYYPGAFIRMGGRVKNAAGGPATIADLCILAGTAAPTDGTSGTGLNVAGAGSIYIRQSGSSSALYVNANTIGSPTWKLVTQAG